MQSRLGVSHSEKLNPKIKSLKNALAAFNFVEYILREECFRTQKTVHALIALDDARTQAMNQIKYDFVEDRESEHVG